MQQLQVYKQVKHSSKHSIISAAAANSQVSKVWIMQQLQVYMQVKHNSKHSESTAANSQVSKF
jgi:hypothetical protein